MRPRSVLLVDDDEDIRESVALILRDEGFDVETAANGVEALEKLRTVEKPCVMILDLMMPVMTGWQVLERLQNEPAHCPVVVMSAAVPPVPPGVADYLRKPVDVDRLLDTVERAAA